MAEPLDLPQHGLIVETEAAAEAVRQSPRHLRKIIAPHCHPEFGEITLAAANLISTWPATVPAGRPIVESQLLQLSWVEAGAAQKPHWHAHQLESYFSQHETTLVFRAIEPPAAEFERVRFTGRIFIPPRVCHLVQLTGMTEVLQVRVSGADEVDLAQDQIICAGCPRSDTCSAEVARAALARDPAN